MATLLYVFLGTIVFTVSLWLGIRIVGAQRDSNTWPVAALFGVLLSVLGGLGGLYLALGLLVVLRFYLHRYYDLDPLQAYGVMGIMAAVLLLFYFGLDDAFAAIGLA